MASKPVLLKDCEHRSTIAHNIHICDISGVGKVCNDPDKCPQNTERKHN